jgi:hypothetical protein
MLLTAHCLDIHFMLQYYAFDLFSSLNKRLCERDAMAESWHDVIARNYRLLVRSVDPTDELLYRLRMIQALRTHLRDIKQNQQRTAELVIFLSFYWRRNHRS